MLSATAPGKPPLPPDAAAWLLQQTGNLFVPAFALHELRRGIAKLDRSGATAQAQTLERDEITCGHSLSLRSNLSTRAV
ncbi:hypothetical protein [Mesorhizobium sp. L-2-11]|uniref:hypothetical protein n=1 Tax=Mesorhizobium sp. L-2-11 TaxID=2744521 RepID=UPI00406C80BC